jgi:SAM-dependent methyltransferase
MAENKHHWYDGWFYDRIIAPHQDRLFNKIKEIIEPGKKVIDVGCGTGRMAFSLIDKCESVMGIDLSKSNISRAQQNLNKNPDDRISFLHGNISEIRELKAHFDYAVITYVIHEVDEDKRIKLLEDLSVVADKIIIGDYLWPAPGGKVSLITEIIEFIAGSDHYRNFRSYLKNGGIWYLADKTGFTIIDEKRFPLYNNTIVTLCK